MLLEWTIFSFAYNVPAYAHAWLDFLLSLPIKHGEGFNARKIEPQEPFAQKEIYLRRFNLLSVGQQQQQTSLNN